MQFRLISLLKYAGFNTLIAFSLNASSQLPQFDACQNASLTLTRLNKELALVSGCPPKPVVGTKPLQIISPGDVPPPQAGCTVDKKAVAAWWTQNGNTYHGVETEFFNCSAKACPAIKTIAPIPSCRPGATNCTERIIDSDGDGIPDSVEASLIARFSPYLRFSLDGNNPEINRPVDPITFVKESELAVFGHDDQVILPNSTLVSDPVAVVDQTMSTSIIEDYVPSPDFKSCGLSINRNYTIHPLGSSYQSGADWQTIATAPASVGMFAHVSPFVPNSAADLPGVHTGSLPTCALTKSNCTGSACYVIPESTYVSSCKHCYKIEYYQFFAFNNAHDYGETDHEGDLSIITLIYDVDKDAAVSISHWVHGVEIRYDMQTSLPCVLEAGPSASANSYPLYQRTCRGKNFVTNSQPLPASMLFGLLHESRPILMGLDGTNPAEKFLDGIGDAQNNEVSFVSSPADAQSKDLSRMEHPVVFVEYGGHEFWPFQYGSVEFAPTHNGGDMAHSYLSHDIPNLGEIEHPAGAAGSLMVEFAGYWGASDGRNPSSPGPSLHTTWNWFLTQRAPIDCKAAEN